MQQITILGNVGRDAVIRDTNGRRAIGFSVAVNESYKDAAGNKVESTNWYSCTIWRDAQQSAKIVDYLKAGQQVLVQGQPKLRTYQTKERETKAEIEIRVDKIELVGGKKSDAAPAAVPTAGETIHTKARPAAAGAGAGGDDDNDLPF